MPEASEPTLKDVIERLDKLTAEQKKVNDKLAGQQQAMGWITPITGQLLIYATAALVSTAITVLMRR